MLGERPGSDYEAGAVESHHPFPAHQHVSSIRAFRLRDRTFLKSPRANATDNFAAVSSSRAPTQCMNATGHTKRALYKSCDTRVTNSMSPGAGLPVISA